ncbi:MAG: hypothetical protein QM756_03685 [Polyangiaceae bacterium]
MRQARAVVCTGLFALLLVFGCGSDTEATFACGDKGLKCGAGELCVEQSNFALTYSCVKNPCGDKAVDCSCAASACGGTSCASVEASTVKCVCINC